MLNPIAYNTPIQATWCPGCGDFVIAMALKKALVDLDIDPSKMLFVFDIGCAGNMADKIGGNGYKGLHGRAIPLAAGAKLGNKDLHVIVIAGDGGLLSEGISHFIHAARSNYDITVVMHDNEGFALTTGQPTSTTDKNRPMSTAPWGVVEEQLNPLHLAAVSGATFLARTYTGDFAQLTDLLKQAILHKGFSLLNILQYCPTYNKEKTHEWFKSRVKDVKNIEGYNNQDINQVLSLLSRDSSDFIPTGLIYNNSNALAFHERIPYMQGESQSLMQMVQSVDISEMFVEYV